MPEELLATAGTKSRPGVPSRRYVLRCDAFVTADPSLVAQWRAFHDRHSADDPMRDPEWLSGYFEGQLDTLSCYSLFEDGELRGLAPVVRKQWPIPFQFGPWTLAELPLIRMRLLGTGLDFPDDPAAYDLLFGELSKPESNFDALYLEEIPIESFLWKYLSESHLIHGSFLSYTPSAPTPRPVLRLEGTYEQYLGKFNSKHRNTINRKIKKLREGALGEMRLIRYESPDEVEPFLEQAVEISRKTYQWALHGRGLSATDLIRRRLTFAAKHGWMRSYLLVCGGQARAFLVGFQYHGRFLLDELGFDPELAKSSVGTVLQMLSVEDLFRHNRPHVFDLQDYGAYKEVLATESYLQAKLFLLRPSAYARFLHLGHRACSTADRAASSLLNQFNLKTRIRQRMRGWNESQ